MAKRRLTDEERREHERLWQRRARERRSKRPKPPPPPPTPPKDKADCRGCGYRDKLSTLGEACIYILVTGRCRPCSAEGCSVKEPREAVEARYGPRIRAISMHADERREDG